jgi:cytochrome b561
MLSAIALMPILGYPAIMYGGIVTFLLVLSVAIMGYRINKGVCKLHNPIKWHQTLAWTAVILGLFHGLLGLSILIGF